jgi:gamma-glutamyltranspeptidase/glutathione hydrolase
MARNGGFLTRADLARVRVRECRPLRSSYRDVEVLTFPPPGGGDQVVEALNILETVLDPRAVAKPTGEHTVQVSVADRHGNMVSLTQTLGRLFGNKVATPGLGFPYSVFLESFDYEDPASPAFLRPGSPCRSDMAPTIVLQDGIPVLALGSAGSNLIPPIVIGVISNVVDRRMGVRDAVVAPRTLWGGHDPVQVQIEIAAPQTDTDADQLLSMGFPDVHRLHFPSEAIPLARFGAVNAVAYDPQTGRFTGVGDARRNGYADGPRVGPTGPPSR